MNQFISIFPHKCSCFFSGKIDLSYLDPVVIGRGVFSVTNESASGVVDYIRSVLCAILDSILDVVKGIYSSHLTSV